jgi:hypothetical protein
VNDNVGNLILEKLRRLDERIENIQHDVHGSGCGQRRRTSI